MSDDLETEIERRIVETENFGVVDDGDHLKVYRKDVDNFGGDVYYVKTAEVYRTVCEDD